MTAGVLLLMLTGACFMSEPLIGPGSGDSPHRFLAEGRDGLVVGLTGRRAVHAGLEALKGGGSAADAALVTALTQVVEAAGSYVSFAGILSLMYHDAATGKVHFLNACYNTPFDERDPLSIPKLDSTGVKGVPSGRTALVPGFMAGVQEAHDRFGKLPLATVFKPAIALADEGLPVDSSLAGTIRYREDVLNRLPETKRIFTKQTGEFYKEGDVFRQPELAETLRQVAAQGAAFMYTGSWARRFVDAVQRDGGLITARDLALYRAVWEPPLETIYRDAHVFAPGLSSSGGVDTVEALNLLEIASLGQYGPPSRSAESLFWLMQITNNQNLGFAPGLAAGKYPGQDLSARSRATKQSARWVWERMREGSWPYAVKPNASKDRPRHSSGVVAVDRWGNVAAVTHSINTTVWGCTGIFVAGVSIPDSAAFQQEAIKQAGPGNRLPDQMCPLIVTRDGKPVLATSAIGGGLHQRNLQILANVLDFGMDAQAAVDAPAFLSPDWVGTKSVAQVGDGSFDKAVLDGVRGMGQEVRILPREEAGAFVGYWIGIQIDPGTNRLKGAGTAELPSHAEGL